MPWDSPAGDFHRHDGSRALQEGNDQHAHHVEKGVFLLDGFRHVRGDRTDQAVAEQNSQECSDKRGGDFVSDSSGGPPRAPIVITTPSTAATMPSPGRESAIVLSAVVGCVAS